MKKTIISTLLAVCCLTSCVDLNIAPKNFVSDNDLMSSESGMNIYMARMYSYMPSRTSSTWPNGASTSTRGWELGIEGTGEALNRASTSARPSPARTPPTGNGIHHAARCQLPARAAARFPEQLRRSHLQPLPRRGLLRPRDGLLRHGTPFRRHSAGDAGHRVPRQLGQARSGPFVRGADLGPDSRRLRQCGPAAQHHQPQGGYANKYVALAFKSEAMLYAGCVAKYNETVSGRLTGLGEKTGVRVIGFDAGTWEPPRNATSARPTRPPAR